MHERHDLDLIAALADGDLEGDTAPVEELVASCPQCRAEFETQREIRALLRQAPAVSMTEDERDDLHRSVHAQLAAPAGEPVAPVIDLRSRRSTRRWLAIGSVAAATLAVVGVAGVLDLGDDASSTLDMATEAARDGADESASSEAFELQMPEAGDDTAGAAADESGLAETEEADDAEAMSDTTTAAATDQDAPFLAYIDAGSISRAELDGFVEETLVALETGAPAEELNADWFNTNDKPTPTCFASVEDPIYAVINADVAQDTYQVLVVRVEDEEGNAGYEARTFLVPGCESIEDG